jgi:hypothetical protein
MVLGCKGRKKQGGRGRESREQRVGRRKKGADD